MYHIHPPVVPEKALKFKQTLGLGGSSLVLVLIQIITGVLLLFTYAPTPEAAYPSIIDLQQDVLFGKLIRNLHHWSAHFLVLGVFLHMLRVFFTGAYNNGRKANWWIGLGLFLCVLTANFTGYLLPLDQLSYWAITICTAMFEYIPYAGQAIQKFIMGGTEIGKATLSNFFAIHVALVPLCLAILLPVHFWRVRKSKGVITPPSSDKEDRKIISVPNLVVREAAMASIIIAAMFVISIIFDAPLADQANPGLSPNPTKAPWYFAGLQELLQHFHPTVAVFIIPFFIVFSLIGLPYIKFEKNSGGTWFLSPTGRKMGLVSAPTALAMVSAMIYLSEHVNKTASLLQDLPPIVSGGLIPVALVIGVIFCFYHAMKQKFSATTEETVQTVFIFLLVFFIVMTIIGVWFRGPGMMLVWPWDTTINHIVSLK